MNAVDNLITNVAWGIRRSVFFITAYLLVGGIGALASAIGGRIPWTWVLLIPVIYVCGGLMAGAIVGALRPFVGNILGAWVAGVLAALPLAVGVLFLIEGLPWTSMHSQFLVVFPVVLGGPGGVILWAINRA